MSFTSHATSNQDRVSNISQNSQGTMNAENNRKSEKENVGPETVIEVDLTKDSFGTAKNQFSFGNYKTGEVSIFKHHLILYNNSQM